MQARHLDLFLLPIPPGWSWHPDDNGGGLVSSDRQAVLHVYAEPVTDASELPNLSRMLAGFLTLRNRPVTTQELLPVKLPGALGFSWQYAEEERAVRVWIAGHPGAWAFLNFHAPLGEEERYRQAIDEVVAHFELLSPPAE